MLELYHHGSSACAAKVRLALDEKQLEWHGHYIDILKGEQFSAEYRAINPKAVVPVLVHDQQIVPESTVICEYLEDAFPSHPLYPKNAYARAQTRLWTKAVDEELHPACSAITYTASHRYAILENGVGSFEDFVNSGSAEGYAARQLKWQWLQKGLEAPGVAEKIRLYDAYMHKMEAALQDSQWLVGDSFSMADLAMIPYVNRLFALSMEGFWRNGRLPRVEAWFAQVQARPAFKSAMLDWVPEELTSQLKQNGRRSWPTIEKMLDQSRAE